MSDIKLKPCPFCGSEAQIYGVDIFRVACTSDDCWCETALHHCKEEAAEDWNMRAVPEPQRWIPVTERLPKRDDRVLVYIPEIGGANCSIQISKGWSMKYVSHWMPLPLPPKEEVQNDK